MEWEVASNNSTALPAVNFYWKAGEAANYLKVKARSRILYVPELPEKERDGFWIIAASLLLSRAQTVKAAIKVYGSIKRPPMQVAISTTWLRRASNATRGNC